MSTTLSPFLRQSLEHLASESLRANIVHTLEGKALRAGGHQFSSLWTRDFCFAVPGLIAIGEAEVARNHLKMLLRSVRPDGAVPRILDEGTSAWRVVRWTVGRGVLPSLKPPRVIKKNLRREYQGEHHTLAYDSGALLYLAVDAVGGEWDESDQVALRKIIAFYQRETDGFRVPLRQPAYSDWQDSARREGPVDFVHYLVLRMLRRAAGKGEVSDADVERFEDLFHQEFSSGLHEPGEQLHAVRKGARQISLETHLFRIQDAVEKGDPGRAGVLWRRLQDHPLYHRAIIPGVPVDPESSNDEVSFFTKAVGLRHYHDRLCWTWLAAEAAKTAVLVGERVEAARILRALHEVINVLGEVPEVLEPRTLRPFEAAFYRSERPFSWGAGKICEALAVFGERP